MHVAEWTAEEFQQHADSGAFMVVAWVADQDATPVPDGYLEAVDALGHDIQFGQLAIPRHAELAATFGIGSDPALMMMRDQIILYLDAGFPDAQRFGALLGRAATLDMSAIRAELQREREAEIAVHVRRVCPTARRSP